MTFSVADFNFKKIINYLDWKLLLFLLLFLDVKLAVKIPAIIIIYLLQFNLKFGFSFKNSRLPPFYLLVIVIAFADLILTGSYNRPNYLIAFCAGIGFWLLCVLAIHQVKLFVENNDAETLHCTVVVFLVINIIFSLFNIAHIIWETGAINPYRYQGDNQKYFIGTGDYIRGVTFDASITNAVLNAVGVIYFLTRKNPAMAFICMIILLLTGSNCVNLYLVIVLVFLFAFKTDRNQKSIIVICLAFLVIFMVKVSPQNNQYVVETFKNILHKKPPSFLNTLVVEKPKVDLASPQGLRRKFVKHYLDSAWTAESKKAPQKIAPKAVSVLPRTDAGRIYIDTIDINTSPYQSSKIITPQQKKLMDFIGAHKAQLPISGKDNFDNHLPGKALAFLQTFRFLKLHPDKVIAGVGMGNFSSKLAFRATSLGFAGSYPTGRSFINSDFLSNHLDVYLNFFSKRDGSHSLTNTPNSVYDQILIEYGILGVLAFAIYYLWFFAKHYKTLTYGLPLLMLILGVFLIDYWFEQLSVLIIFELLLFIDIKQTTTQIPVIYEYQ